MDKKLKIGLFGFGCVGQGLYDILNRTSTIPAEIKQICVKNKSKERSIPMKNFTFEKKDILNDPEIDVVVELIDTADEAFEIVKVAMNNGKAVVSANKKMIAENFRELVELQEKNKVSFLYEASSCASIPIIRNLEEYYDNDLLNAFEGIFNGSSNFILSNMVNHGSPYGDVLKHAQDVGFAESNPILDVGGFDSKYKLCILTAHAFGLAIKPEEVFNYGIQTISDVELNYAKEKGYKIKLFASSKLINGKLATWVMPQFVTSNFKLFNIENEYNGIVMEGAFSDAQQLVGKGAGSHPTGSAVISDISALVYDYKYEYKKFKRNHGLERNGSVLLEVYLRYPNQAVLEQIPLKSIDVKHQSFDNNYVIGKMYLEDMANCEVLKRDDVFLAQTPTNARDLN